MMETWMHGERWMESEMERGDKKVMEREEKWVDESDGQRMEMER